MIAMNIPAIGCIFTTNFFLITSIPIVWGPSKEIWHVVESTLTQDKPPDYHEFETVLKKYKPQLLSLFSFTVSNFLLLNNGSLKILTSQYMYTIVQKSCPLCTWPQ